MPIAPMLVADTVILIGVLGFAGLFLGLAFLRLFVPESHWLDIALHRIEGHLEFGGQSIGSDGSDRDDCGADGGGGD